MDTPTIQLFGKGFRPTKPKSLTRRQLLARAGVQNDYLGQCAALGYCVPRIGQRIKPGFKLDGILEYGERVSDYLQEQGATFAEIQAAAIQVWLYVVDGLPDWSKVRAAEGFTETEEETSTEP
jgi:hypothetical protein